MLAELQNYMQDIHVRMVSGFQVFSVGSPSPSLYHPSNADYHRVAADDLQ